MDNEPTPEAKSRLTVDMPTRKPRGFKIALLIMAVLLVLFVCTIIFLPSFLPTGTIRGIAQTQARELAGVHVDFEDLRFGWNGDLVLDNITVSPFAPDGTPADPLLTINEVRTNVALMPLLSGKAVVNSVDVNGFAVNLVRDAAGKLNLPDLENLPAPAVARADGAASPASREMMMLSAARAEEAPAAAVPPVEIRQVNLQDGVVHFTDEAQGMRFDLGVQTVTVEGGASLDEPFNLSGRINPYAESPDLGAIDFDGTIAMLKGGQPDFEGGRASLEATVAQLSLAELARKLNLSHILPAGLIDGTVKIGYAERKGGLVIPELRIAETTVGIGEDRFLPLPDTRITFDAAFDPAADAVSIASASIQNDLVDLTAGGTVASVSAALAGGLPGAELDFGGTLDFANASHYASTNAPGLEALPELDGRGSFSGALALPAAPAGTPPAPTLTLALEEGDLQILENATGISADLNLRGIAVAANATLSAVPEVQSRVELTDVPVRAFVPQLGDSPVSAVLTGGAAFEMSADAMIAELRAGGTSATLPATPYSTAARITDVAAHITADLKADTVTVRELGATVNDSVRAGVAAATLRGVLAGAPQGTAELRLSALLAQLRQLAAPVYPAELLPQLEGSMNATARVTLDSARTEALVNAEFTDTRALVAVDPVQGVRAEVRAPQSTVAVRAALDPANPARIAVQDFQAEAAQADIAYADAAGQNVSGRIGNPVLKLSGTVDTAAMRGELASVSLTANNGLNVGFARQGAAVAALTAGLMRVVAGAEGKPVLLPLSGAGDFALPQLDLGIDQVAFNYAGADSRLGDVRARVGVDGYIGSEKRQVVILRTAALSTTPAVVNSRGLVDLGTGAFVAEYAARVNPSGLSSVLAFLGLPPALLTQTEVRGTLTFENGQFSSKSQAVGALSAGRGEVTPFETAHDLSAGWNPADGALSLDIRRLDGSLKTAAGEAVATMQAQPSQLVLSSAGSRGALDVQFSGSAAPTRSLVLGLAGVLPQLADFATTLASAQASGLYNARIQVVEKTPTTLGFSIGGSWRGAALSIDNAPYLSEAGELAAALEGELAYQENTLRLSRLYLNSESAQIRADGAAAVVYTAGADRLPIGLANVNAQLRFDAADVALAGRVFPGVLPQDLGMSGRVALALAAAGDAGNVQISQGTVNFQNFRATPSPDLEVTIPQGALSFGAALALRFDAPPTGSEYDIFRQFDVNDGRAGLTGALIRGKQVNNMSSTFGLRNGVFTINDAQVAVGGGADGQISLNGTVDFTRPAPAVNVRLAMRNIPLREANSEMADYMQFREGALHIPAQQSGAAGIAFSGFSETEILRTLRLENFTFGTGPVALTTGPALNAELDRASTLLKMGSMNGQAREITLTSIDGSAVADGTGVITFPQDRPVNVVGNNTADFRLQGAVKSDMTIDVRAMIAGNLQKMITIPNLIPNLSLAQGNEERNLMSRMNANAANGNYGVNITGPVDAPNIGGISEIAMQFLKDLMTSVPTQLLGNVLDVPQSTVELGRNVVEGLVNPGATLKNAPENLVQGLGGLFGLGGNQQQPQQQQPAQPQQQTRERPEQQLLRGLGNLLGGSR